MTPIPLLNFREELENIPEVINAFLVTGQTADFLVEVIAKDMENYSEILLKRIGKIEACGCTTFKLCD